MKTILRIAMVAAIAAAVSPSVLAFTLPPNVPDAGASALLLAIGTGGVMVASKFLRKK